MASFVIARRLRWRLAFQAAKNLRHPSPGDIQVTG